MDDLLKTSIYSLHKSLSAKLVSFAGWEMPLYYKSQVQEHIYTRTDIGIFDVSHMVALDIDGKQSKKLLSRLIVSDIRKIADLKAMYSCILNHDAGIKDDLIVYKYSENKYKLVLNASMATKDIDWINHIVKYENYDVKLRQRSDLSIIAIQGPNAVAWLQEKYKNLDLLNINKFSFIEHDAIMFARTGYTGEDGFELILPHAIAVELWSTAMATGVHPCGLGCRDSLRMEYGYNLYGSDMDEEISPYECGLKWIVDLSDDRDFIGKKALISSKQRFKKIGVILLGKGVLRYSSIVETEHGNGIISSGGYSPILKKGIGIARLPIKCKKEDKITIINHNKTIKGVLKGFPLL